MTGRASAATRMLDAAWGVALAAGLLTLALGVALVVWPEASIKVVAILFGLQLMIHGVFRIAQAIMAHDGGGTRVLYALIGALSFLVGVLALRNILQTVIILTLLFGLFWLIAGILEFVKAVTDTHERHRGWAIALAVLTTLAGIFVLAYPDVSLLTLTIITGIWFITWGALVSGMAIWIHRQPA
ncbi:DUF308 domain-containing protein [Spirillospora sp. NPDC047279]|uniref:HdeD family acid-resistance protein n=1 Tax=Spirillospora sp. NPDC047279 TaxID=3155478 RepID=UPI0033D2A143